jgi:hypothetical protein
MSALCDVAMQDSAPLHFNIDRTCPGHICAACRNIEVLHTEEHPCPHDTAEYFCDQCVAAGKGKNP